MIERIRLKNFKNFEEAELTVGPFSVLIGANGVGKSNIREAFRFLKSLAHGYTITEAITGKWTEDGILEWRGIRGGKIEIGHKKIWEFELEVHFTIIIDGKITKGTYLIGILSHEGHYGPRTIVTRESLKYNDQMLFNSYKSDQSDARFLDIQLHYNDLIITERFSPDRSILYQLFEGVGGFGSRWRYLAYKRGNIETSDMGFVIDSLWSCFYSMKFYDFNAASMRVPSQKGLTNLGENGENLASLLQSICDEPKQKNTLIQWLKELLMTEAKDFRFWEVSPGKVTFAIVQEDDLQISAASVSDGTLRFLVVIASFLSPSSPSLCFFEELENGIYPSRLYLLLQLIEKRVSEGDLQVIATTHSPILLGLLSSKSLEYASLIYRLPEKSNSQIKKILDMPDIKTLIEKQDIIQLYASGWLEDAIAFTETVETT